MVKRFITALIMFLLPLIVWAQSPIALLSIDFSEAEISQSGPESFYVRNVVLPDQTVSLSIVLSDEGHWEIDQIYPESDNYIPADVILDFATIEVTDDDKIEIDWIIYKGSILSGVLGLSGETITISSMFSSRGILNSAKAYPTALSSVLESTSAETDGATADATVSAPASPVQSYIAKLDTLQTEIAALRSKVSSLEEQLSAEMLSAAATVSKSLAGDIGVAADSIASSLARSLAEEIEGTASSVASSVSTELAGQIEAAEASIIESLSSAGISKSTGTAPPANNTISKLQAQIAELKAENALLTAQMKQLEEEIRSSFLTNGFIAMLRPALTETLVSGFETSEAQLGFWRVGRDSASQLDKSMLFGKLLLPVTQNDNPVLYSFKARSTDPANEWVGLGLHIFVENVEKRGYGLGDSLLVWLTRDQEVYKNNYTYLQLYRSDDDVNMDRVMDAVIQEPITEFIRIEVLYQPVDQYITIAVDGEEKIRYKTWFGIDEGVEVALRSLGTAKFRDLRVTTMP